MSFVLELFDTPELPLVLGECQRMLKQGGRIGLVSLSKKETAAVHIYEWFHMQFPALVDCRPIYAPKSLEQAGFHTVKHLELVMWGLPVDIIIATKA